MLEADWRNCFIYQHALLAMLTSFSPYSGNIEPIELQGCTEHPRHQAGEIRAMAGILSSIGMALTVLGFIITFIGVALEASQGSSKRDETRKTGGLIMIGPIPIIFGSDSKTAKLLMKIAVGLFILFFILLLALPFFG